MPGTPVHSPAPAGLGHLAGLAAALVTVACGSPRDERAADSAARAPATPAWSGQYALRGTIARNRPATGSLTVDRMDPSAPLFDTTQRRVRRTYPEYAGPFYSAQLTIMAGRDTIRGDLTCAHGPADRPPLVCEPVAPLTGLEGAALVVRPDGRAVLAGSHGEGVSTEYGRFTWVAHPGG